jgi:cytochrome c-type biogenesis protein CcmH
MPPAPLFWLVALLLAAASVTALVWPLLRNRAREAIADDAAATDVYRDQKRQLDEELAAGAITHAERDAQVDELATRLSRELDERVATTPAPPARSSYVAALILVAVIPVAALALYATFGSPAALRADAATTATSESKMSAEEIDELVGKLAARMKERPEDPKGWELLARTYAALGRFDESVAAYKEAAARGAPDASLYADWADAVAMRNQSLGGEASQLIAQALALDPNHPKALALAATAALQRKDYAGAIADWRKLKAQFPPQSDEAKSIDAMIAEADAQRGEGKPPGEVTAAASASASAKTANASPAENAAITGRVSLDPKLRDRVAAGETLFIYARPASGSRMPLAVLRLPASDLPHDFRLDDSLAMTPAAKLSTASEVIVEARISKTGSATPAPGDLRGTSGPLAPGAHDVLIVINDVVR